MSTQFLHFLLIFKTTFPYFGRFCKFSFFNVINRVFFSFIFFAPNSLYQIFKRL